MAQAKTARGTKLLIKIGDGGSPEAFVHNCSISGARSFQLTSQTNDVNVPDCDDPELMAWLEREKVSLGATIQGAGVLNTPDLEFFYDYASSSDPKNIRVVVDVPGADGGGYFSGAFHCTDFQISGDRGQKTDFTATFQSTGEVTFTANA
jgi:predicted secreted protein